MVSEIFRTLGIGWAGHDSGSALESGISNLKLSCKTIYQYLSYQKKFRTIPSVASKILSGQNFSGFGHARGPALVSNILNFETLLHNFTSISTISLYFRTIRPVVTENSSGQNLGGKKKKQKKRKKKKRSKNDKSLHFLWETYKCIGRELAKSKRLYIFQKIFLYH